jgi:hypothetical protein
MPLSHTSQFSLSLDTPYLTKSLESRTKGNRMLIGQTILVAGIIYIVGLLALMVYALYKEFRGELDTPTGRLD